MRGAGLSRKTEQWSPPPSLKSRICIARRCHLPSGGLSDQASAGRATLGWQPRPLLEAIVASDAARTSTSLLRSPATDSIGRPARQGGFRPPCRAFFLCGLKHPRSRRCQPWPVRAFPGRPSAAGGRTPRGAGPIGRPRRFQLRSRTISRATVVRSRVSVLSSTMKACPSMPMAKSGQRYLNLMSLRHGSGTGRASLALRRARGTEGYSGSTSPPGCGLLAHET